MHKCLTAVTVTLAASLCSAQGIINTFAGGGTNSKSDNIPATRVALNQPNDVLVDPVGNVYIADSSNGLVRKVNSAGIATIVAGTTSNGGGSVVDNIPVLTAQLNPKGIALDAAGNLYIAEYGTRVRKVNSAGIITTVAGTGLTNGFRGDNGPATSALLSGANRIAFDSAGNLYIADSGNNRIRKVDASGIITTVAGDGTRGYAGDGGSALNAKLYTPSSIAFDPAGNLYIADYDNNRIRKVNTAGIISTVAGDGSGSCCHGDGGPAIKGDTELPYGVATDSNGNFYIATTGRIAKVDTGGIISTIAGNGTLGLAGFGGTAEGALATKAYINTTFAVAFDNRNGNCYIVTPGVVWKVTVSSATSNPPSFTSGSIVNATGYQNRLAPDTVFVIFGSGLGPDAIATAAAPNYPSTLGGTSVTFTPIAGGSAVTARMVYSIGSQIAGLLPSSITPGTYAVRVTYNNQISAPQNVTVVARSFGVAAANNGGTGLAQATIGNINGGLSLTRFTGGSVNFNGFSYTLTSAHPGDTLVLWGTGGGADSANDSGGSSGDQTVPGNFIVLVGGRTITPLYAGASSGYPGLWQINFTLPSDVTLDCFASVQVSAAGDLSNSLILPITAAGQSSCSDPSSNPTVLSKLDSGGIVTFGAFAAARIVSPTTTQETVSGSVFKFTTTEWITLNSGPKFGACRVYDRTFPVGGKDPGSPDAFLDAGTRLPFSGPNIAQGSGLGTVNSALGLSYVASLSPGTLANGTYTLTGPGGSQVGPFNVSVVFPASFNVTNWDSIPSIDRTKPLTYNWTASAFDQVAIVISTANVVAGSQHLVTINCTVPGSPGTYTIPTTALAYLLPAAATGTNFGSMSVQGIAKQGTFTATLTGGDQLDLGVLGGNLGVSKNIAVN